MKERKRVTKLGRWREIAKTLCWLMMSKDSRIKERLEG